MKTKRFLTVFVMAAFLVASCAKEATPATQENIHSDTPGQEQGGVVVNPDGTISLTFCSEAATRTSLASDGKTVNWTQGDAVRFWGGEAYYDATAESSAHSTAFSTITVPEELDALYATYPAGAVSAFSEGTLSLTFPKTSGDGTFASADISVAKTVKTAGEWNTSLHFKNVASLLQISVTDNELTRITVQGLNDEPVCGTLSVSFDGDGNPVLNRPESTDNTKTITLNIDGAGEYFIPVIPNTFSKGFRVTMHKGTEALTPFTIPVSFDLKAGQITKLSDLDTKIGHYYVSPDGAGMKSGHNWNNAMDAATFKAFVENQDNHFLLKGSTFHFSAEEFSFGDDYLKPNYPDHSNVAFTLEGTVTATDTTTFLGRTATSGTTAGVLWPQANSYITVKNVKFTGTNGASNAAAIRVNTTGVVINLEDCVFEGNQTIGQSAAINMIKGTANLTGCTFSGNSATKGASLHVENATVSANHCTFTDNTGEGGFLHCSNTSAAVEMEDCEVSGGNKCAIYNENANTVTLTRVKIHDVHAVDDSGAAGWLDGAGTLTFTDCEFVDNCADWRGGAIVIASGNIHASFTGGKFQGNHADGAGSGDDPNNDNTNAAGGAIYAFGTNVSFDCTNVLFKENYNFIGTNLKAGGIIKFNAAGTARFDGCVFDGNYTNRNNSNNASCAAIVNHRTSGVKYYFNACDFKENTSGTANETGKYGGTNGTLFAVWAGGTIAMNNCSMHDNYGGRNTDNIQWIHIGNGGMKLIVSNSTIVGDRIQKGKTEPKNKKGVIMLQNAPSAYFINSIVCSNYADGASIGSDEQDVTSYYSKTSPELDSDTIWSPDTGSGHDYYASSSCFGGWTAPYIWNGTMTGTNSDMKAATTDVNTEIQNADADFYSWLNSIGALGKDINGNDRGTTSWPGCYQN